MHTLTDAATATAFLRTMGMSEEGASAAANQLVLPMTLTMRGLFRLRHQGVRVAPYAGTECHPSALAGWSLPAFKSAKSTDCGYRFEDDHGLTADGFQVARAEGHGHALHPTQ